MISIDPYVLPITMARAFFLALRGYSPGFRIFPFLKNGQFQTGFRFVIQEKAPLSTYKFSTLNSIHLIGRHFINCHYLFSWLSIDFVKGKLMLITLET